MAKEKLVMVAADSMTPNLFHVLISHNNGKKWKSIFRHNYFKCVDMTTLMVNDGKYTMLIPGGKYGGKK